MDRQTEREYKKALDSLGFSSEGKERIMKNLLEQQVPKPAKRKGLRTLLIAAALAVGCALMIAAAMPAQIFSLASGAPARFQQVSEHRSIVEISGGEPLEAENGRLWLVIQGERTDITDLVDADTPYIYDNTDPDTGCRDCLVVGGTPEDHGWIEFHELDNGEFAVAGGNMNQTCCVIDGVTYDYINDLTEEQRTQVEQEIEKGLMEPDSIYYVWKPWYLNAEDQLAGLGLPPDRFGYTPEQ